jgi:hypothetical protein
MFVGFFVAEVFSNIIVCFFAYFSSGLFNSSIILSAICFGLLDFSKKPDKSPPFPFWFSFEYQTTSGCYQITH